MTSRPVAFATTELHPFSSGGIGRLVSELVRQTLLERRGDVHVFVPSSLGVSTARLTTEYGERVVAVPWNSTADTAGARSAALCTALKSCRTEFEWIEFPDFQGLGFAALHEPAGLPGSPSLHVRVHGPASLIAWLERERISGDVAREFDVERSCLASADLVVAPSEPVLFAVASFFRFDADWKERAQVRFPPRPKLEHAAGVRQSPTRIIFPTKMQRIKRPDLFLRAAARLVASGWPGRVTIAAHRNEGVESQLLRQLPTAFTERLEWVQWSEAERRASFAGQVLVVPSDFETLSLAAWEATVSGARLVASTRCPAFATGSVWDRWPGFFGFDGSEVGLFEALDRAVHSLPPQPFDVPADRLPVAPPRATPRALGAADFQVLVGDEAAWARAVGLVQSRWVVLVRDAERAGAEALVGRAVTAFNRSARLDVLATLNEHVASPAQLWSTRRRAMGPLVLPTEFARHALSPTAGRRAALASAQAVGLGIAFDLHEGAVSLDDEAFPPSYLDAHPVEVATQRDDVPPFRDEFARRAKQAVRRITRDAIGRLKRR